MALAAPDIAVLRQAADVGEDVRRAAVPEARVPLPEVFGAVRAAYRLKLSALCGDPDAELFVFYAVFHGDDLPLGAGNIVSSSHMSRNIPARFATYLVRPE